MGRSWLWIERIGEMWNVGTIVDHDHDQHCMVFTRCNGRRVRQREISYKNAAVSGIDARPSPCPL